MAVNKIELKRSAVPGRVPSTSSLDLGELAINTYDGKVFFKQSGSLTSILEIATISGSAVVSSSYAASSSYSVSSSYALSSSYAVSASRAVSASYAINATTASYAINTTTASYAISASRAVSASYAINATTSSYSNVATSASYATNATTSSYAVSASQATSASAAISASVATTASYAISASAAITASYAASASAAISASNATTASCAISASQATSASAAISASVATTASYALTSSYADNFTVRGTITAQTLNVQTVSSSVIYSSGSNTFGNNLNNTQILTGSVSITGSLNVNGSSAILSNQTSSMSVLTASYANNATTASYAISASQATSASQAVTASYVLASNVVGLNLSQIGSGSVTASTDPAYGFKVNAATSISGTLNVSQSINAYNINAGNPTSNQWQTNLSGSYFNNFTTQTDVSEILRFIAGLLSSSAPDASPNTRTYSTYTANAQNTTTGTVIAGSVPQSSTNTTVTYLTSKGFANTGSTIFSGIATIYTAGNYGYTYTSVAGGSTIVTSSADAQLFGLGQLSSGTPTSFKVSGSFTFRFKNNAAKTDTATSSSNNLITQTGAGTTSGVSLAKINTANPAVIPAAYQDGKYASVFSNLIYSGSATAVSSSGYYHISASIAISSGSSAYTTPIASNAEIFYAPLTTISTNIPSQTPTTGSTTITALTAVSRSLSGAPYLSGSTYNLSSSFTNLFNPLYYVGTIASLTTVSTGMSQTSGVTSVLTTGGTIQTANAVFDSTGTTLRSTSTIPYETDLVKLNGLYTFTTANITNIGQTTNSPTTFTVSIVGVNKAASTSTYSSVSSYHTAGTFGQPASSGSLAYFTRAQGADTGTYTIGTAGSLVANFTGESYRLQINDSLLSGSYASGSTFVTSSYVAYNLGSTDLQIKPGYLVKPGGTYGYWLTDPNPSQVYKYAAFAFNRNLATNQPNIVMTLAGNTTLVDWANSATNNSIAILIIPQSVLGNTTQASGIDPVATSTTLLASGSAANPFNRSLNVLANTNTAKTNPFTIDFPTTPNAFPLNTTYRNFVVLVRYIGDPTPLTSITLTVTA